jgi:hypothetical protein
MSAFHLDNLTTDFTDLLIFEGASFVIFFFICEISEICGPIRYAYISNFEIGYGMSTKKHPVAARETGCWVKLGL